MNSKYYKLLYTIAEKLDKNNSKYVTDNIELINNNLSRLSEFFNKYINISGLEKINNSAKYNLMKNELDELNINEHQFSTLLDKTDFKNLQSGGQPELSTEQAKNLKKLQDEFVAQQMNSCLTNIPGLMKQLAKSGPKIIMDILYELGGSLYTYYEAGIDWVYFWLFITASIPVAGILSDFIIVVKGLSNGDYFLATITAVTGTMSTIVSMHTVDLGVWFKIFYYIDRKGAGIRSAYNKIMNPDQCGGGDELSEVKKIEQDFRVVDLPELLVITGRACTRILSG